MKKSEVAEHPDADLNVSLLKVRSLAMGGVGSRQDSWRSDMSYSINVHTTRPFNLNRTRLP